MRASGSGCALEAALEAAFRVTCIFCVCVWAGWWLWFVQVDGVVGTRTNDPITSAGVFTLNPLQIRTFFVTV